MKRISPFIAALLLHSLGTIAETTENFNTQPSVGITQVKSHLVASCWQFYNFDINQNWIPGIEGDGAMVSGTANMPTGIYTPLLHCNGVVDISFKYKFQNTVTGKEWFTVYVTDESNNILRKLDEVQLTGLQAGTVYQYKHSLAAGSGTYKIYLLYRGQGGMQKMAIDKINIGAALQYNGGCNTAPVPANDAFSGAKNRTASGSVILNDREPNGEAMEVTLLTNSADGTVLLNSNGTFTFTPNSKFNGQSTSFNYMLCDNGSPRLCTNATATITFPQPNILQGSMIDFLANYSNNKVTVNWTTTFEVSNAHFDVERSTDGTNFKKAGTVESVGTSNTKQLYTFTDNVNSVNTAKKDLYYRLKQVDKDGNGSYSKVLIVRVYNTKTLQVISVTPNPAINNIKVNMELKEDALVIIKILDNGGTELLREVAKGTKGANNIFEVAKSNSLPAGIYMLEVIVNSNERMMVKLMKS